MSETTSTPPKTLDELAARVAELTSTVTTYLRSNGHAEPSLFDLEAPVAYPPGDEGKITMARHELLQHLADMQTLVLGPKDWSFMNSIIPQHDQTTLDMLSHFAVFTHVPLDSATSYSALSAAVKVPEDILRRVLRQAYTMRVFREATLPDADGALGVAHTALSAFVARDPVQRAWLAHNLEDVRPASMRLPEVVRRFAGPDGSKVPQELLESGFGVEFGSRAKASGDKEAQQLFDGNLWTFFANDDDGGREEKGYRARRFAQAMLVTDAVSAVDFGTVIRAGFAWDSLPQGAKVVDVGGASGKEALMLLENYASVLGSVVVQDRPDSQTLFEASVPAGLRDEGRLAFQTHDFFAPQPVAGADVYFLKMILHDWSTPYAARILEQLVKAMVPGKSRIVLCESVMPPPESEAWKSLPLPIQRLFGAADLQMMCVFNAKERTIDDWRDVLAAADQRLFLEAWKALPGSPWAVLTVGLRE